MNHNDFISMIESQNYNISMLRDKRQDMVIHLTTDAETSEEFQIDKKLSKHDAINQALKEDKNIKNAQAGHPRVKIISGEDKFNKCVSQIEDLFNKPRSMNQFQFKFLLKVPKTNDNGIALLNSVKHFDQY